jgi:3-keto steroid reductase
MLGSSNHTIQVYKAAFAAVHLSLISLTFFPAFYPRSTKSTANGNASKPQPMRFKSESDRWGTERVGVGPMIGWDEHEEDSKKLVEECEKLYQQFRKTERAES